MSLTVRPGIMEIVPYVQGKSTTKGYTGPIIKLSSNEAALGPSPRALEAYSKAADSVQLYCDGSGLVLREAIGEVEGLDPKRIVCGAGSDELIALLVQAYAGIGDEVLYSQYGFLMYPISSQKVGAIPVTAPETNLRTDVDAMLASVTSRTRIVFVANPNNPTGSYISREELIRLRKGLPSNVLLVIDGAYAEFVDLPDYTSGQDIVDMPGENTVMLRTFSKIYGLAALRLGWAYCPTAIADVLHRVRGPFNISGPAVAAGVAAIKDIEHTQKAKSHNALWLKRMQESLTALGLTVYPSVGNFLLVAFSSPSHADAANQHLQQHGIIVRGVESYRLPHCLRITIGKEEENQAVLRTLETFFTTRARA